MSENLLLFRYVFNRNNDLIISNIDKRIKEEFDDCSVLPFTSSNGITIRFNFSALHLYNRHSQYINVHDTISFIHFPRYISEGTHNHFTSQNLSKSQMESLDVALEDFHEFLLSQLNKNEINPCVEIAEEYERLKPEIGLKPRNIHESLRVQEICEAIIRYKNSDKSVPEEWIEELSDLVI